MSSWPFGSGNTVISVGSGLSGDRKVRMQWGGTQVYTLRNNTNEGLNLVAYYCKSRGYDDVESVNAMSGYNVYNDYNIMGRGFSINGKDNSNPTAANTQLTDSRDSPFGSYNFVRCFKIQKVKRFSLGLHGETRFKIKIGSRIVRPQDLVNNAGLETGTNITAMTQMNYHRHWQRFILFKLSGRPAGVGVEQNDPTFYQNVMTGTTPSVIMKTDQFYWARMLPQVPSTSQVRLYAEGVLASGIIADTAPQIMVDSDEKAGPEAEAK